MWVFSVREMQRMSHVCGGRGPFGTLEELRQSIQNHQATIKQLRANPYPLMHLPALNSSACRFRSTAALTSAKKRSIVSLGGRQWLATCECMAGGDCGLVQL